MRVALIVCLFVNGGINVFPLKKMVSDYIGWKNLTITQNISLSFLLVFIPTTVASFFSSIEIYVSITGCFAGTLLVIFFPALMGVKIKYFKTKFWHYFLYFYIVAVFLLTMVCSYFTIMKFVKNK